MKPHGVFIFAIEKSNDGLYPPPKLLISHKLPVLSGSNHEVAHVTTQGVPLPTPTPQKNNNKKQKKQQQKRPAPYPKKKKKKEKKTKKGPGEKKEKKEGAIFANPPSIKLNTKNMPYGTLETSPNIPQLWIVDFVWT